MKLTLLLLLTGLGWGQPTANRLSKVLPRDTCRNLTVDYMLRGYFYAASSVADTGAAGGSGGSDNQAKTMDGAIRFAPKGIQLYIDTTQKETFAKKYNGQRVYLINATDTLASFPAMDSRLSIHAEALIDNHWQPIEHLPKSWCGNSYHTVYLRKGEYWAFVVPVYGGKLTTKLRYKLAMNREQALYSNEITASINAGQLTQKQGHRPTSIMDPYDE